MTSGISLECEMCTGPENLEIKGGNSSIPSSSQDHGAPQIPVKKQRRQWAAWTRQEEERFFAALRQVGKNFEKITYHVQSKNKNQVRHYYYRLVRRMNKLLDPELCLDAKNSKDTNAAMLRWWSLLEKYSCKSSKLHLKPRRLKIFIETLENQLLKDKKKKIKKQISSGENNSPVSNVPAPNQVKTSVHDKRAVKLVLVDTQNIQKVGTGKGSLLKRHLDNMEMNRTNGKIDPTSVKATKHRRKTGIASTAAYKRWEKAAIAGVALVADAAEHLERVNFDKDIENGHESTGHDGTQHAGEMLSMSSKIIFNENNLQSSGKLRLQFFPIDECTRKTLEMDHHNPHLELTLSTRKKISSVLEHLNRKWGNSNLSTRELTLFPYWAQRENLVGYQKWTKDSPLCAGDIYHLIGNPPLFRLRYGWFSKAEAEQNSNFNTSKEQNNGNVSLSAGEWADSLTNISMGDLFSESTHSMEVNMNCSNFSVPVGSNPLMQIPFSCDSFDAAIAAHIYKHQERVDAQQGFSSHVPSIWEAEETCDAFAFQKNGDMRDMGPNLYRNNSAEEFLEVEKSRNRDPARGDLMDECRSDHNTSENCPKDFGGITDMYWPDSLGPLDLELPSCRYPSDDLILNDNSLGGLNRLIANSLDAFQSCFGSEKKEHETTTPEPRQTATFSDLKIQSEV